MTIEHPSPTILLTNDDGPISKEESPFIYPFSKRLISSNLLKSQHQNLKVIIPNSQKSWISKSYLIQDKITIQTYDPSLEKIISSNSSKDQNHHYWYLINGTPATCSNIGLFNLFPGSIDLVISGPNFGRNTSTAFSLSSGTIGAAMDAAISNHKSIALSYGVFDRPISDSILEKAHSISIQIIEKLWHFGFDRHSSSCPSASSSSSSSSIAITTSNPTNTDDDHPDMYSINIPLVPAILDDPKVIWTFESNTRYGRLFLPIDNDSSMAQKPTQPVEIDEISTHQASQTQPSKTLINSNDGDQPLEFVFKPDISSLIDPNSSHHPPGSDAWALNRGYCTVTPLKAAFKKAKAPTNPDLNPLQLDSQGMQVWKL